MEDQTISFKTAKVLKRLGFNEICSSCYHKSGDKYTLMNHKNDIGVHVFSAPTQTALQRWLREKYNVDVEAYMVPMQHNERYLPISVRSKEYNFRRSVDGIPQQDTFEGLSESYEEALEIGLQVALSELPIK